MIRFKEGLTWEKDLSGGTGGMRKLLVRVVSFKIYIYICDGLFDPFLQKFIYQIWIF